MYLIGCFVLSTAYNIPLKYASQRHYGYVIFQNFSPALAPGTHINRIFEKLSYRIVLGLKIWEKIRRLREK